MAVSAFPALVDALVERVRAALPTDVDVFDGAPNSDSGNDFVAIGVPSLDDNGAVAAGSSEQEWATIGQLSRQEEGRINCVAAAHSEDESLKDARDKVSSIAEAVATVCRTRDVTTNVPNLGVETVMWCAYGGQVAFHELVIEGQPRGYAIEFQIGYKARI